MLERLSNAEEGLQDHELLEILLFNAIPRKNTNEIAHALLDAFGNLQALFTADMDALMTVHGIGRETAAYLRNVFLVYQRARDLPIKEHPDVSTFEKLYTFVRNRFACRDCEFVELYAIDSLNRVTKCVYLTSHDTGKVHLLPETVDKFFADAKPRGVILAHNHLCNNSRPSQADDAFTRKMFLYCELHGADLLDHLILSNVDAFSYRLEHRLDEITRDLRIGDLPEGHLT